MAGLIVGFPLFCYADYKPCYITLYNLSAQSGPPGTEIVLYGVWGHTQGKKIPVINKGKMNKLEVISWLPSRITARIPENLLAGNYKVGVYCNDLSEGGAYSSGWVDFEVEQPAEDDKE